MKNNLIPNSIFKGTNVLLPTVRRCSLTGVCKHCLFLFLCLEHCCIQCRSSTPKGTHMDLGVLWKAKAIGGFLNSLLSLCSIWLVVSCFMLLTSTFVSEEISTASFKCYILQRFWFWLEHLVVHLEIKVIYGSCRILMFLRLKSICLTTTRQGDE